MPWPNPLAASAARAFGVRPGEGRLVAWLLAHSFFNGVAKVLNATAAYTLFLVAFDARAIPYVYVGAALAITAAGYLFIRLEARFPFYPLAAGVLVVATLSDLSFRALLGTDIGRGVALAFTVWSEVEIILLGLVFWGLAGKLFDIQQGKRLFGLVGTGEVVAAVVGGVAVGWIVPVLGARNLLLISAGGLSLSLAVFARITRLLPTKSESGSAPAGGKLARSSILDLAANPYVRLIFLLITCTYFGHYFLENVFFHQAEERFATESGLASFLGLYLGAAGLLTLASRMIASGRLLRRFGVVAGLLAQPLSVGLLAAGIFVAGAVAGAPAAVFWLVTAATLTDRVLRESLSESTRLVLYQPLPARERVATQATVESMVGPLAGGLAGLTLLLLTRVAGFSALELVLGLLVVLSVWAALALLLRGEYTRALVQALSRRKMADANALVPDAETLSIVAARLESPYPSEVSYALELLERMGDPALLTDHLGPVLRHPAPDVRADAAERVERLRIRELVGELRERAETEEDPVVQGRLRRTLASLGQGDADEWLADYRRAEDDPVREGVLIGMLASDVPGVAEGAAGILHDLVGSAAEGERALAVRVVGASRRRDLAGLLRATLEDPSDAVRGEAIDATPPLGAPELWPSLLANLAVPELRGRTIAALAATGAPVLTEVGRRLADPRTQEDLRVSLVRVCGRIGGLEAVPLLLAAVRDGAPGVREAALDGLVSAGFQADGQAEPLFGEMLERELAEAAWVLSCLENLREEPTGAFSPTRPIGPPTGSASRRSRPRPEAVLAEALENEFQRLRERILDVLSILYPGRSVSRVRSALDSESGPSRAYAIELLENLVAREWRTVVVEVLANRDPAMERPTLHRLYPQPRLDLRRTLRHILSRPGTHAGPWLSACALYVAREHRLGDLADFAASRIASPSWLVRETAAWALAALDPGRFEEDRRLPHGDPRPAVRRLLTHTDAGGTTPLPTIQKALALRNVGIFRETPGEVLAEIARMLGGHRVRAGQPVLRRGETGDSMFLLIKGSARVHDGERTLDQLAEGAIFGEFALLDPAPRSASVTALEDCELFSLRAQQFHQVVDGRLEVARGLFRVLCRRLRHANEAALPLLPAKQVASPGPGAGAAGSVPVGEMTTSLERVLALKSVPILSETPESVLAEIAALVVERRYRPGSTLVRKGEPGTTMFVVVEGDADVHDGDRVLARVSPRGIFGELALLDSQPRSASVTAINEVHAFVLEQADFYELLGDRPEVVRALFRVLARHIRAVSRVSVPPKERGPGGQETVATPPR